MQAWVVEKNEQRQIDDLQFIQIATPAPGADELLVKVHSVGLNPVDYKVIEGGVATWHYPHVVGLDVAGEVVAIGTDVSQFTVGERVFYHGDLTRQGGFAEFATPKADVVAKMPADLTYAQAAALLCGAMTAYQAIFRKASLTNRHTALIHAGAGGVGGIAIQLAKLAGLKVLTTVSKRKQAFVTNLHPDFMIDYRTQNVTQVVQQLTAGLGVDLIVNTIGAKAATADLDRLAYNGALVTIDGQPDLRASDYARRGIGVFSVNLGGAHQSKNPQQRQDLAKMATELGNLVVAHKLNPLVERQISFQEIPQGLQAIKAHEVIGKIVANWD
ncbi:alcohol dehydrogenase catalytic domain-containing protein [Pediococcus siamensis]|uniref:alcohol dehydrogenase catalytic domain-containing protein n=1 Tax=Pediococcus siamensis TaxID=381829 RepID=UPI0039A2349C